MSHRQIIKEKTYYKQTTNTTTKYLMCILYIYLYYIHTYIFFNVLNVTNGK